MDANFRLPHPSLIFPETRLLLSFDAWSISEGDALLQGGMLTKANVGSCELTHWPAVGVVCAWPCTFAAARAEPLGSFSF